MDSQVEKVYVALGNDLRDGLKTLEWTLGRWKPEPISIVILHVTRNISEDFVYTVFGKLPASAVSDEKLEVLKKYEQQKIDTLLSKYIAFCGKVKAEIMKVEESDEPFHKALVELITRRKVTKLVMGLGISCMKSSSRNATRGLFYIREHKPEFCEFFLVCGGKLIIVRGENDQEGIIEDDQGVIVSKKVNFKCWFGKKINENSFNSPGRNPHSSPATSKSPNSSNSESQWENCAQEIESYFEQLLAVNLDQEIIQEEEVDGLQSSEVEPEVPQHSDSTVNVAAKVASSRSKLDEAQKTAQLKKEETKANAERRAKAERAIFLSNSRVQELKAKINEEVANGKETSKNFDAVKEQIQEVTTDVEHCRNRISSILEIQSELSNKLHTSSLARSNMEAQLEKAVDARVKMVREIKELRRQRDILQRRIKFCKEKDDIGMVTGMNELGCSYREYNAEDIRSATNDFSESLRLKSRGNRTNVYRGCISHVTVAIKMPSPENAESEEAFLAKVKLLNDIRYPNLVAMMGFCSELKCVIFEYMHNGSLEDILFSSRRIQRKRYRALRWHDRIRIAHEVCLGLSYLHLAQPRPIFHGHLSISNVLLDRNLVAKISGLGLARGLDDHDVRPDIRAFGVLLLHLLTGTNRAGLVEEAMTMDRGALVRVLDEMAGQWPLDLVEELVGIATRCLSIRCGPNDTDLSLGDIMKELNEIRRKADDLVAVAGNEVEVVNGVVEWEDIGEAPGIFHDGEDSTEVPSIFLCPILGDVMKDPHVAADGFSYELEGIEEWLRMGRDASPKTQLRLKHKFLTPNHNLRDLIQDWQNKKFALSS